MKRCVTIYVRKLLERARSVRLAGRRADGLQLGDAPVVREGLGDVQVHRHAVVSVVGDGGAVGMGHRREARVVIGRRADAVVAEHRCPRRGRESASRVIHPGDKSTTLRAFVPFKFTEKRSAHFGSQMSFFAFRGSPLACELRGLPHRRTPAASGSNSSRRATIPLITIAANTINSTVINHHKQPLDGISSREK